MTEGGELLLPPNPYPMSHKTTTPVLRSAKRPEILLLEQEARKEAIERKGKNYRFWLLRRKLYHLITVYSLIFGLIAAIVFLWKNYILKYDWLSIDTVTLNSNGIFNSEQVFDVMGIGPHDNIFFIDTSKLEERLKNCPAIKRASVKRRISSNPTLLVDIDARIPVAWIDCPELGIHPKDFKYGALIDKEGVIFPCIAKVHLPYIQGKAMPSIALRPPSSGQLSYGVSIRDLEAPMQLIELLSGPITEYLPGIISITTPNDWSFCVHFTNDCRATFSHYGLESQVEKLARALQHARQTHRKISSINLIPEHNIPVIFDNSYETIPLAEPIAE